MKIFLSYGHDDNAPLVNRIRRDLQSAGHDVWIDHSEIKVGDDWRRRIQDGLLSSDWALAFLSKHSTREPGVCLDEIRIALSVRGGIISTVLVEDPEDVRPPVTLSHIQWLDMHDWRARHAGGEAAFEPWYAEKLHAIVDLLANPSVAVFAGEIEQLERRLRPARQASDIPALIERFVGREWILEQLEAWRSSNERSRIFCLTGDPGSGKSAFSAWLAHHGKANVVSLNLCRYNIDDRRDAGRIIRTLAFQAATRLADYRAALLRKLELHDRDGQELAKKSAAELFEWLLVEPLRNLIDGGRRDDPCLLVIDALDETIKDGASEFAEVVGESAHRLPPWMLLLVTTRVEGPIIRSLAGSQQFAIEREQKANRDDIRRYVDQWIAGTVDDLEHDPLAARIVEASGGNFQYVSKLRDGVEAGIFHLADEDALPPGLTALYGRWFARRFPDKAEYERTYVPLLEVLTAAQHPVPEAILTEMFFWTPRERARVLEGIEGLFERGPGGIQPYHKSLRDWLNDERAAGPAFVVDPSSGASRLFETLSTRLNLASVVSFQMPDEFTVADYPLLVASVDEAERRQAFAPEQWAKFEQVASGVIDTLTRAFRWTAALSWCDAIITAATTCGAIADYGRSVALLRKGYILALLGRSDAALASYHSAADVRQRRSVLRPADTEAQHDLVVAYVSVGDAVMARGDSAVATDFFNLALGLSRVLVGREPTNLRWQHDLALSHDRIGGALATRGDFEGALASFEAAADIFGALLAADHPYGDSEHDVVTIHNRIGDLLVSQGEYGRSLAAFNEAIKIVQHFVAQDPSNPYWLSELGASYDRVGSVLTAQGDRTGAMSAFRDAFDIEKKLAAFDPENAQRLHDLGAAHAKIGDMLFKQGEYAAALTTYHEGAQIAEGLVGRDLENVAWGRTLEAFLNRIGDVWVALDNRPSALTAYRSAMDIARHFFELDPNNDVLRLDMCLALTKLGDTALASLDTTAALEFYRAGMEIVQEVLARDLENARWLREALVTNVKIGRALVSQNNADEARTAYRDAIELAHRLLEREPESLESRNDLGLCYYAIGDLLATYGDADEALSALRYSAEIAADLTVRDSERVEWQRQLLVVRSRIGDVLSADGDSVGAMASYQAALEVARASPMHDLRSSFWGYDVMLIFGRVGDAFARQSDRAGALEAYRSGIEIARELTARAPENDGLRNAAAYLERRVGDLT